MEGMLMVERSGNTFYSCMYKQSIKWYSLVGYFIILMVFGVIFIEGLLLLEGVVTNLLNPMFFLICMLYFSACGLVIVTSCSSVKEFFRKILFEIHVGFILTVLFMISLFCCTFGVAITLAVTLSYIFFKGGVWWLVGCVIFSMLFVPINISLYECLHLHKWFDTATNYINGWFSCKSE